MDSNIDTTRAAKVARLRTNAPPRTLDLFSGCGGLSLGFQRAGFEIVGAADSDLLAIDTHARNFYRRAEVRVRHAQPRDLTQTEPARLLGELGVCDAVDSAIDVVVGGPPCQAFARVGRAKLREVDTHPEAFRHDPRGGLYLRYLHYVQTLKPIAVLMENVPDVLNYGGHNIAEEMCQVLEGAGYICRYTLLNAAHYGVPQMRKRLFLLGYAKELAAHVGFPYPTHWVELPKGYMSAYQTGPRGEGGKLLKRAYCVKPPRATPSLIPAVSAREALEDLPPITAHREGKPRRDDQRFAELARYRSDIEPSCFALAMRNWPGFENQHGVTGHVTRYLPRDFDIFRRMNPGDQFPQAYQHALDRLAEKLHMLALQGQPVQSGTPAYEKLKAELVPPYDPTKFPNKWRKMEADLPARTLMAHLAKDGYSHIHYDSAQARTVSVREAARLQSFPDGFLFKGPMNPAFGQIGNAVPPVLAYALACEIRRALTEPTRDGLQWTPSDEPR